MKGFTACGKNLGVTADMDFAKKFFAPLHGNFQEALAEGKLTTCFLIQAILIEGRITFFVCLSAPPLDCGGVRGSSGRAGGMGRGRGRRRSGSGRRR